MAAYDWLWLPALQKHLFASRRETAGATFLHYGCFTVTSGKKKKENGIIQCHMRGSVNGSTHPKKLRRKQQLTTNPTSKLRTISKYWPQTQIENDCLPCCLLTITVHTIHWLWLTLCPGKVACESFLSTSLHYLNTSLIATFDREVENNAFEIVKFLSELPPIFHNLFHESPPSRQYSRFGDSIPSIVNIHLKDYNLITLWSLSRTGWGNGTSDDARMKAKQKIWHRTRVVYQKVNTPRQPVASF